MSKPARKLIGLVGGLLFFTFGASFLTGLVCTLFHVAAPCTRFPLNDVQDVVVDRAGHIYVGIQFYSRVQQYAADGRFLRGWSVPEHSHLRLDGAGRLQVVDRAHVRTYGPDGSLVSTAPNTDLAPADWSISTVSPSGDVYEIRDRLAFPRVVRTGPEGRTTVLIADPWYKWPIILPIPGLLLVPIAALMIRLSEGRRRRMVAPDTAPCPPTP